MYYFLLGLVVLAVIVITTLKVDDLFKKILIFLGLAVAGVGIIEYVGGEVGEEILKEVFMVDYPQFIFIPLVTVAIAALNLFAIKLSDEKADLGWFLWLGAPLIGNFATTWAIVPIGLSLVHVLKRRYPEKWLLISIAVSIFSMNILALLTLAADPPQAYWAVKAAAAGDSLGFFFPAQMFAIFVTMTMILYFLVLRRLGVRFGSIKNLLKIRPENPAKLVYGLAIVGALIFAITGLSHFKDVSFLFGDYNITAFLGGVTLLTLLSTLLPYFSKHDKHNLLHWGSETATIFLAFFTVVAFAHLGLHDIELPSQIMTMAVIGLTMTADNAAAFAAGYPVFNDISFPPQVLELYPNIKLMYQSWFNLFNSVTYGGLSPIGNGPQIVLYLVILTGMKMVTPGQVFKTWLQEAWVYGPYLLIWTLSMTTLLTIGIMPIWPMMVITGLIAIGLANESMDIQKSFRDSVDE